MSLYYSGKFIMMYNGNYIWNCIEWKSRSGQKVGDKRNETWRHWIWQDTKGRKDDLSRAHRCYWSTTPRRPFSLSPSIFHSFCLIHSYLSVSFSLYPSHFIYTINTLDSYSSFFFRKSILRIYDVFLLRRLGGTFFKDGCDAEHYRQIYYFPYIILKFCSVILRNTAGNIYSHIIHIYMYI